MADQKISQLNEVTSPNSSDVLPIVNNGETKKITVANLAVAGSSGTSGSNGSSGTSGVNGTSGSSGTSGIDGSSGTSGINGTSGTSGVNGTNGSSGSSGSGGTSGTSGTGISASYVRGSRSTEQTTGLTANALVRFTQVDNSTGSDISLNTSTGQITLEANRTYRLMAQIPTLTNSSGGSRPSFSWYNETTSGWTGSLLAVYAPGDGAVGFMTSAGMSEAVITTTGTTVVSYRIVATGSLASLGNNTDFTATGSYPWFDIQVISGMVPLMNGTSGTSGTSGVVSYTGLITTGSVATTQSITGSLNLSGSLNIISGSVTMQDRPAFRVYGAGGGTAATTVLSGSMTTVDYSQGNAWNNSNGTFTAPVAGLYQVNLVVRCVNNSSPSAQVIVYKNNTTTSPSSNGTAQVMLEWAANTTANHIGGSTITKLAVGDTLKAIVTVGTISFDGNDNFSVAYIG